MLAILAIRLGVPLLIPRFPVPAILACLVVDAADQTILQQATDLPLDNYQGYDKALDIYYLSVAYLSTVRNWTDPAAFAVGRFLWYYRLVGVVAFELSGTRALLLIFPNTFEYFFIAYEAVRLRWDPRRMVKRTLILLAAAIWIFVKLPQEWWIHVAQLDFTDFMKEDVLGVTVDTGWGEALAENLWFVALLVLVAGVLVLVGRRYRSRLPAPDWALTTDVDRHLERPGDEAVDRRAQWRSVELLEKMGLVALISIIFASVLPGIDRGPVQTGAAVAVLVLVASLVSHALGPVWSRTPVRVLVLAAVNFVVIDLFVVLGRNPDEDLNVPSALFFALLIALQVGLYDQYRAERRARQAMAAEPA